VLSNFNNNNSDIAGLVLIFKLLIAHFPIIFLLLLFFQSLKIMTAERSKGGDTHWDWNFPTTVSTNTVIFSDVTPCEFFDGNQSLEGTCNLHVRDMILCPEEVGYRSHRQPFTDLHYIKNAVFWDVVPCRSCVNRRFEGTYRLHLQGRKIRERGTCLSR
jgi:hypothetical protein